MDVLPNPPIVSVEIQMEFTGASKDPIFSRSSVSPTDAPVVVRGDGGIDLGDIPGWVVINFNIKNVGIGNKAKFPEKAEDSLTYADNSDDPKRPWREGDQFSDIKVIPKRLSICYTNNNTYEFSRYGIKYNIDGKDYYYDPRIKNGVSQSAIKPRCKFPK